MMNRRSLLTYFGKAAAATLSPSLLGALPLPPSVNSPEKGKAEITNGSSSFQFGKGPAGLGLELSTRREDTWRRVASVQSPVRILYDHRANGSEKDVEFTSALPAGQGLLTSTEFI